MWQTILVSDTSNQISLDIASAVNLWWMSLKLDFTAKNAAVSFNAVNPSLESRNNAVTVKNGKVE